MKLTGALPCTANLPKGCVFHTRCPQIMPGLCDQTAPPMIDLPGNPALTCHLQADQLPHTHPRYAALATKTAAAVSKS